MSDALEWRSNAGTPSRMSKTLASVLTALVEIGSAWMKPYRRTLTRALVSERLAPVLTREAHGVSIGFATPTARALHDPWKIAEGEPETIRWLDGLRAGEALWDIGADIGVYSLCAAMVRKLGVLAFEPGASSYAALVRNVELNGCEREIAAYCRASDERTHLDRLFMASTEAGHSMHSFGQASELHSPVFR